MHKSFTSRFARLLYANKCKNSPAVLSVSEELQGCRNRLRFFGLRPQNDDLYNNETHLFTHSLSHLFTSQKTAFTLAEVLITLAIIGVVAAITLPSVIINYQKKQTISKLKTFNSIMSQAFAMAENDYGPISGWDRLTSNTKGEASYNWFNKYLLPYIQYTEAFHDEKYTYVGLKNGMGFTSYFYYIFPCTNFTLCKQVSEQYNSRNRFIFVLLKDNIAIQPYTGCSWDGTREGLINGSCGHACNNKAKGLCAKLIQYDGWEISDDYPW